MNTSAFASLADRNECAIDALRCEKPAIAIALLCDGLAHMRQDLYLKRPTQASSPPPENAPTILAIAPTPVGSSVDIYQNAFRFYLDDHHESSKILEERGCKRGKIPPLSKTDHDLVSVVFLYNLSLSYHILGIQDQSKQAKALTRSRRFYSLTLEVLLQTSRQCPSAQLCRSAHDGTASSATHALHPALQLDDCILAQVSSDNRGVILLAAVCNLRHIHCTFFDATELMMTTELFKATLQRYVSSRHEPATASTMIPFRMDDMDVDHWVGEPTLLPPPCSATSLLSEDDVAFFFFSLLVQSGELTRVAPAA